MSHVFAFYDFTGKEIQPGDFIVYAANGGRSAILKYGAVVKLVDTPPDETKHEYKRRRYVSAVTVDVWPNEDERGVPEDQYDLQAKGRAVAITEYRRCVVVEGDVVPSSVRAMFAMAVAAIEEKKK